ncbi:MAG: glycosyltransferase, partial [Hymenobacter sp.]
ITAFTELLWTGEQDRRGANRYLPRNPRTVFARPDGWSQPCLVMDYSASGAAVSSAFQPAVGEIVTLGSITAEVVRLFDVGLLPSYFASESLPNCIAEYLFCGAPVVATRIGEIPQMLAVPGQGLAGVLLEQNGQGLTDPAALTAALRTYLTQPAVLAAHRALARQCFDKFRMERCVVAYEELFAQARLAAPSAA